jgi:hypothetical protein
VILLAVDPGRHTGWALYDADWVLAFGQFSLPDDADVAAKVRDVLSGKAGYPHGRFALRPALAVVEEHSAAYHVTHGRRGSRSVGEHALARAMAVNIRCRRRVEAALLAAGVPSLGWTPEEWGARGPILLDAQAELARAGLVAPDDFTTPAAQSGFHIHGLSG